MWRASHAEGKIREDGIGPNVLFGAVTVRSVAECESASRAGAAFLVAPGVDVANLEWARRASVLLIPGVFTASEVQLARAGGRGSRERARSLASERHEDSRASMVPGHQARPREGSRAVRRSRTAPSRARQRSGGAKPVMSKRIEKVKSHSLSAPTAYMGRQVQTSRD